MWVWPTKCFCLCCFICCEICGGSLYAARGTRCAWSQPRKGTWDPTTILHLNSTMQYGFDFGLCPTLSLSPCNGKSLCNPDSEQDVKMFLSFSPDARSAFPLSAYKHFISETFPDVNCKCITHIPSAHIIFRCSCVCPVSCWTRWTASTHCTESRWSWPPTDRTLWTQPCCGPEDWIVKSVRSSPLLLVLCLLALCEHTHQI